MQCALWWGYALRLLFLVSWFLYSCILVLWTNMFTSGMPWQVSLTVKCTSWVCCIIAVSVIWLMPGNWCCANIRNFEWNRIVTSVFHSKRAQLFEIFEYLPSPISYLFNRMMPIFHLSSHTWQPTKSVVTNGPGPVSPWNLYIGPCLTNTTKVRCHKNSGIYLTSRPTYYWWLLRPTITIRFEISNTSWAIRFDSKWKKKLFAQCYW